jgi:hypothetical protein
MLMPDVHVPNNDDCDARLPFGSWMTVLTDLV